MTELAARLKKIKIEGSREKRVLSCPYCDQIQRVTLVTHLKRKHPAEWERWSDEFVRLYNETNDLKKVMRVFTNSEGTLILSWTVIDQEIQRKTALSGVPPQFNPKPKIHRWHPTSEEYQRFRTTVWDIPNRGTWGVHQSTYRGNWAPQVPRALIETFSKPGDLILDPFLGGGTTLIEAWSLGRHATGFDVSETALSLTRARLAELEQKAGRESLFGLPDVRIEAVKGDARKLPKVKTSSVDFICTHPPYGDALSYSHNNPQDLSLIKSPEEFLGQLEIAARRFYEVLKPEGFCAIVIGDLRRNGALYPFGFETLNRFQKSGFVVCDIIIKTQSKDRSTEFYFNHEPFRFRIAHEYLLVFRKT